MKTIDNNVIEYSEQDKELFPRKFRSISIREAIREHLDYLMNIRLIPKQSNEKPKSKAV